MNGLLPDKLSLAYERFRHDSEYRELISTSFYALLVRFIGVGTGFLVVLVTSRYFSAEALGIVSICMAILSLSTVFGKMGLDIAMMRFIAQEAFKKNFSGIKGLYILSMRIILPVSFLISVILFITSGWMAESLFHKAYLEPILKINAWIVLPLVLLLFNSECMRGLKKVSSYTFFQTAAVSTFALIFLVMAVVTHHVPKEIPVRIQFLSITLIGLLSTTSWIRQSGYIGQPARSTHTTAELLKTSSPMFMTTLMQLIMSWAGTLILASFATGAEVGVYNALVRISAFTNITILAFNSITMPRFAESFAAGDPVTLKRHAKEAARLIFLTSLPIFIGLFLFPKFILGIFGKEFPGNEPSLFILLVMQFIVVAAGLPAQILNMTGRQHYLRNIAIFAGLANVISCFLLIPPFGILGACIAQLIGTFFWNGLCIWSVHRHFGFYTFYQPRRF